MEFFDIAAAAGRRWQNRAPVRSPNVEKIRSGKAIEAESAERIQKRFSRLAESTRKASAAMERVFLQPAAPTLVQSIGLERVIGRPDFLDINFIELALAVARFVGRVNILTAQGRSDGYGTGFMVSPRLLLTNNHVLTTADVARHSMVEFDFQNDRAGRPLPVVGFRLDPGTFFMTSETLDFSLVAVSETSIGGAPLQRYGWSRLIADQGKALLGEPLNIIQHPRGESKQVVLRSNELVDLFDQYAHYVADTEPGSSGAPVYNDQWELVALHHSGVPRTDSAGRYLAKDGSVWTAGMDPDKLDWVANEGIRISSLVDHISRQPLSGVQAQLRQDLLTLEPPSPLEAAAASQASGGTAPSMAGGIASAPTISGQGATWTIPLTVTVQLGLPVATQHAAQSVAPVVTSPSTALQAPVPSTRDPALTEALAELDQAAQRPYYDAQADHADRDTYYGSIDPSAPPDALFDALHQLLDTSHANRPSYKPAKHLYPWVDLHPPGDNGDIVSIYSRKPFSARELIEADFRSERERATMKESFRRPALAGQESALTEAALEAAFPYNCEHVVPQSWFAEREPMRGDLHHLFACETDCNSFRGRLPFFDFPDVEEKVKTDCGRAEQDKFEPVGGKGPVARATLYFLLRYPGQINRTLKEYTESGIATLLKWHTAYPVDDYERHRNAAIFEKQGNRNPLIDFPEWVNSIDFARGLG